jgi:hypothetical protein
MLMISIVENILRMIAISSIAVCKSSQSVAPASARSNANETNAGWWRRTPESDDEAAAAAVQSSALSPYISRKRCA